MERTVTAVLSDLYYASVMTAHCVDCRVFLEEQDGRATLTLMSGERRIADSFYLCEGCAKYWRAELAAIKPNESEAKQDA
jgi:hypothetical protein